MKPSSNNIPITGPAEWLNERQMHAQQFLAGLRRDCEMLDRTLGARENEFDSRINRIRTAWEDAMRSRSNEKDKRQLLDSIMVRLQNVQAETRKREEEIEKLEESDIQTDRLLESVRNFNGMKENLDHSNDSIK